MQYIEAMLYTVVDILFVREHEVNLVYSYFFLHFCRCLLIFRSCLKTRLLFRHSEWRQMLPVFQIIIFLLHIYSEVNCTQSSHRPERISLSLRWNQSAELPYFNTSRCFKRSLSRQATPVGSWPPQALWTSMAWAAQSVVSWLKCAFQTRPFASF